MAPNEMCLYNGNHIIPIHQRNGYSEDRHLNINIFDFGDKLQIKLRDLTEHLFNYTEYVDLGDFEVIRANQSLDINYIEFKTNIVDMLHQFNKKEMFLKCELCDRKCTLVFFTKSKIKSIVYLTLDLQLTDQKEIIAEMYSEMHELQDTNKRLQKQLSKVTKIVQDNELEVQELKIARKIVLEQCCKNLHQIEGLFTSKLAHLQKQVLSKIATYKGRVSGLQKKVDILKQENNLKVDSSDRLMKTMENLRLENLEYNRVIQDLKKENSSLNILRVTLERNIADLKQSLDDAENVNKIMDKKRVELEKDLEKLSIIVTEKESKISELSKDLVQANNMLVQFNNHFDTKVQQVEELQEALSVKERLLMDQKCQTNQILNSFDEYKRNFNTEKFENMKRDLLMSNKKIHDLEEEMRKLNKINALLSQKVSQGYFNPK